MSEQPNIVVIFPDQLRRDALSIYGDTNIDTPHIDLLCSEGVRFRNACSTYPICVPFRFSLMTGEYAHTRYVPGIEWRMSTAERTLADEFNDGGYQTIYVGKWHLYGGHGVLPHYNCKRAGLSPVKRQFQGRWQRWLGFDLRNDPFDTYYFENDDPKPRALGKYQTDGLFDLAMGEIENRDRSKPFVTVISVEPPHFPYKAPHELEAKWLNTELDLPVNFMVDDADDVADSLPRHLSPTREKMIENRQLYYAMIENLDHNVGRLRGFLEEQSLDKNTIVVLFSDHGEMGGAHGLPTVTKHFPYEESAGIPLIVSDPTRSEMHGGVVDVPTCSEDLFVTLLGLAGIKPRDVKPGCDLTGLVEDVGHELPRPGVMLEFCHEYSEHGHFMTNSWRAFRSERYMYTTIGDARGGGPWQFFDLQEDPYELKNLINSEAHAQVIKDHHKWLCERMIETDDHFTMCAGYGCEAVNPWMRPGRDDHVW